MLVVFMLKVETWAFMVFGRPHAHVSTLNIKTAYMLSKFVYQQRIPALFG